MTPPTSYRAVHEKARQLLVRGRTEALPDFLLCKIKLSVLGMGNVIDDAKRIG